MKFVIVLCILSALLLQIDASPVKLHERDGRAVSRQQSTATNEIVPAAAPADEDDEDDDDDDDDDDGDIGDIGDLVDDDEEDDDDEEEDDDDEDDTPQGQAAPAAGAAADDDEEDDDDDYLDRLFDDILGDDDDEDDDDEEISPAASVQNTVAAAAPSASVADDIAPVGQAAAGSGISDGVDLPLDSGNIADSSAVIGDEGGAAVAATNNKNEGAAAVNNAVDEADETEDDDDDDDDDDIIGDDVIEARREARALKNNIIDMSQDAFQERHNHFIDSIFDRINRMVADNYDPFFVRLNARAELKDASSMPLTSTTKTTATSATTAATTTTTKATTANANANKTKSSKKKRKNANRTENRALKDAAEVTDERKTSDSTASAQKTQNKLQQQMEQLQHEQLNLKAIEPMETTNAAEKKPSSATTTANNQKQQTKPADTAVSESESPEVRTVFTNESSKSGNHHKKSSTKTTHKHSANKTKAQKLKQSANAQPNHSGKVAEKYQNAEGSLSGLSSLKRVGNVKVTSDAEGRNSTIKAKFTLGPLILRVEKSIKRGGVRNVKSATARTNEMIGRIKFSVVNDNATLMSIKVQQPKQVEFESKDNHDNRQRMIMVLGDGRRTPKFAKLVNEKLKLAVESILTPQAKGVEVVRL